MPSEELMHEKEQVRRKIAALIRRLQDGDAAPEVLREAVDDLSASLEELRVADEEMRAQNEALLAARTQSDEARKRYLDLFMFAPDPYLVTDLSGNIIEAGQASSHLFRQDPRLLVGIPLQVFVPQEVRWMFRMQMDEAASARDPREWETQIRASDGTLCDVAVRVAAMSGCDGGKDGLRWILRDVTERRRAEREYRALQSELDSLRPFREISENAVDAQFLVNREGRIYYLNRVGRERLGIPANRECPIDLAELDVPIELAALQSNFDAALERTIPAFEATYRSRSGTELRVELTMTAVKLSGHQFLFVSVRDVVERHRLEEALLQRADDLAQADRRKDEFLAMLGHELRNPLAPIVAAVEILSISGADPDSREYACAVIERQVRQKTRLKDDLLDVSRITRGKIRLNMEEVDLAPIVTAAIESIEYLVESNRHVLQVQLPDEPLRLRADPARLTQIVSNLLNNAAKYTDPGGRIGLSGFRDRNDIVVRIRDSGIGISPEMLPRIFEAFTQGDPAHTRSRGGLGIGLTLVRSLVQMHGGAVRATSEGPGMGSEFEVRIPALKEAKPADDHTAGTAREGDEMESLRILAVDDYVDAAQMLGRLLRLDGHVVEIAHDGTTAIAIARDFKPDVILLDIGLPDMDGYEIARRLRGEEKFEATLIALTGYGQEQDKLRASEAGFDFHLVKPVDPQNLRGIFAKRRPTPRAC